MSKVPFLISSNNHDLISCDLLIVVLPSRLPFKCMASISKMCLNNIISGHWFQVCRLGTTPHNHPLKTNLVRSMLHFMKSSNRDFQSTATLLPPQSIAHPPHHQNQILKPQPMFMVWHTPLNHLWLQSTNGADDNADIGDFVCEISLGRDYHAEHRLRHTFRINCT